VNSFSQENEVLGKKGVIFPPEFSFWTTGKKHQGNSVAMWKTP